MAKSLLLITMFFSLAACSSNVSEVNNDKPASFTVEPNSSESIVLTKPVPLYDYMNKDPSASNNDKYCVELSQKVQQLKGKPQRHYAAQKRYEAECKF